MDSIALIAIVGFIGLAIGFVLGVAVSTLRGGQAATPSAEQRLIEVSRPSTPAPTAEAPPQTPAAKGVEELPPSPSSGGRPILNPVNILARALQQDVRAPEAPPRSIAAQIDDILQEKLKDSPLAGRAIRLMELPNRGMVVMVGLNQYDGVEAVPDEEIRNLIRSAVAEWEERASGE
jgi:hypothetical protein